MQVTITVDCTPEEARRFLGLPDLQPMQAAVLEHMQKSLLEAAEQASPEAMLRAWMPLATPEAMAQAMAGFTRFWTPKPGGEPG